MTGSLSCSFSQELFRISNCAPQSSIGPLVHRQRGKTLQSVAKNYEPKQKENVKLNFANHSIPKFLDLVKLHKAQLTFRASRNVLPITIQKLFSIRKAKH